MKRSTNCKPAQKNPFSNCSKTLKLARRNCEQSEPRFSKRTLSLKPIFDRERDSHGPISLKIVVVVGSL